MGNKIGLIFILFAIGCSFATTTLRTTDFSTNSQIGNIDASATEIISPQIYPNGVVKHFYYMNFKNSEPSQALTTANIKTTGKAKIYNVTVYSASITVANTATPDQIKTKPITVSQSSIIGNLVSDVSNTLNGGLAMMGLQSVPTIANISSNQTDQNGASVEYDFGLTPVQVITQGQYIVEVDTDWNMDEITISAPGWSYDPSVTACGTLPSSNTVYTLILPLSGSNSCIVMTGSNSVLDCWDEVGITGQNTITGTNATGGQGIVLNGFNDTVNNCNVSAFAQGIVINGSNNDTLNNDTINGSFNGGAGIYLPNSNFSTINGTTINTTSNADVGVWSPGTVGANNITVANSSISTTGSGSSYAVYLQAKSQNWTIFNNTINTTRITTSLSPAPWRRLPPMARTTTTPMRIIPSTSVQMFQPSPLQALPRMIRSLTTPSTPQGQARMASRTARRPTATTFSTTTTSPPPAQPRTASSTASQA
jgi:hypothetical protein